MKGVWCLLCVVVSIIVVVMIVDMSVSVTQKTIADVCRNLGIFSIGQDVYMCCPMEEEK